MVLTLLKHADKHYTQVVANRHEVVLLDCLKPAIMECDPVSDIDLLEPAQLRLYLALSQEQLHVLVDRCVDLYAFGSGSLQSLGGSVVVV